MFTDLKSSYFINKSTEIITLLSCICDHKQVDFN